MSKGGRPPNEIPTVPWKVQISIPVAAKVDLILLDPMREKVTYGARSRLVQSLLERWLEERKRTRESPSPTAEDIPADTE